MRSDRQIIKGYLGDYGNWLENPISAIGYPEEVKLAVNIYDTFDKPDIRQVYRNITGKEPPIEEDQEYIRREKEYREANYVRAKESEPKRRPRFPWFDLHTQMNELNKITHRLEERLQVIMLAMFKDRHDLDKIAGLLLIEVATLKGNIGEMYDRVGEEIRESKYYKELFYELYHYDNRHNRFNALPMRRKKRKRALKVPKQVKPNFPETLSLNS